MPALKLLLGVSAVALALGVGACVLGQRATPALSVETASVDGVHLALERHPQRMEGLLAAIDVTRPGLEEVRTQIESGDQAAALRALVRYYRAAPAPPWIANDLTSHAPRSWTAEEARAEAAHALGDVFTFQGVTGQAPRLASGGLDWTHRGPRDDLEWALFFNRHFHMLPMLRQYLETGDRRYAASLNTMVIDWVSSRPMEETDDERAMSASWRPMSSASRLLQVWPHLFFRLRSAPEFSDEALLLMLSSIPEQAGHVQRHHRERHNHTIKEMAGLVHAGAVWPEFAQAQSWRDYGIATLTGELQRQFYPDGVHQELSAHYHRSALEYFVWTKDFMAAAGHALPDEYRVRIERAAAYLVLAMSPTGFGPLNNNGDLDANRDRSADLAERFDDATWRHVATLGQEGTAPALLSYFYPWAGQVFFRNGWGADAHFALFDIGPWGAAHQHNDKLNLVITAHGRDLLVDGGRYRYTPDDPYVAHLRSTGGHNTLLIDGFGQGPDERIAADPLTRNFATHPVADAARGAFIAGYPGLDGSARHERTVVYVRDGYWVVFDRLVSDRPRAITALWRFHPDMTVRSSGSVAYSDDPGTGNLRITPLASGPITLSIVRGREAPSPMGWFSPGYNVRLAASVAVYETRASSNDVLVWVLTPSFGNGPAPAARRVSAAAGHISVEVSREASESDRITIQLEPDDPGADVTFQRALSAPVSLTFGG